jgi:hypothetical protein
VPYLNVGPLTMWDNRSPANPIMRDAIERADCIVDATLMKRGNVPTSGPRC